MDVQSSLHTCKLWCAKQGMILWLPQRMPDDTATVAALQGSQNRCLAQVHSNTMSIQQVSFVIVREKDKSSICSYGLSRQHACQ